MKQDTILASFERLEDGDYQADVFVNGLGWQQDIVSVDLLDDHEGITLSFSARSKPEYFDLECDASSVLAIRWSTPLDITAPKS